MMFAAGAIDHCVRFFLVEQVGRALVKYCRCLADDDAIESTISLMIRSSLVVKRWPLQAIQGEVGLFTVIRLFTNYRSICSMRVVGDHRTVHIECSIYSGAI